MATLTKAALARRVPVGKPATAAIAGSKQVPLRDGLEQLPLLGSKSIEPKVLSVNYIKQESFLNVSCVNVRGRCIDIDNLSELDDLTKVDIIDVLYENSY